MAREGPGSRATEADVLYLEEDAPPTATDFGESDGRHHVRFDAEGGLTGSASVVVHGDLEAGRRSAVTGPEPVEVGDDRTAPPLSGPPEPAIGARVSAVVSEG